MPSKNNGVNELAGRIISICALYPNNNSFIRECGISNQSLITDLKKGRVKYPGAEILASIVRGTGCNGTWLLTGEGEMFDQDHHQPGENGMSQAKIKTAINLLEDIEQHDDALDNIDLPKDLEIRLIRLALKIMERGRNDN